MLLDELMPVYDVRERHRTVVSAPAGVVFAAIRSADLGGGVLTRALLVARAVPAAISTVLRSSGVAGRNRRDALRGSLRLADFERSGFTVVGERAPEEIVIGLLGRFWTAGGGLCARLSAADFVAGPPPGYALAGWNFTVGPHGDGATELRTETRVLCAADARLKFRAYWLVVRPGSGLIRRAMLRGIRDEAERINQNSQCAEV